VTEVLFNVPEINVSVHNYSIIFDDESKVWLLDDNDYIARSGDIYRSLDTGVLREVCIQLGPLSPFPSQQYRVVRCQNSIVYSAVSVLGKATNTSCNFDNSRNHRLRNSDTAIMIYIWMLQDPNVQKRAYRLLSQLRGPKTRAQEC
jgi:hypothetical protein